MSSLTEIIEAHRPNLDSYEELCKFTQVVIDYKLTMCTDKHFHAHPELSYQEKETAAKIVEHLESLKAYDIHPSVGGHGVAAVLTNGEGKTILLRADIDGLPVEEQSGLSYASTKRMKDLDGVEKPTMHACGHDIHITSLLAAAEALISARDEWTGTLVLVFQPAEERAGGAQAMVDDGLYKIVLEPDLAIGAHVIPRRAGRLS
jgi:amidohydrolase